MVHEEWALACVRDAVTAWNCRDWSAFESLHTHDVVYDSPHSHVAGRGAVLRRYQELVAIVPDLHSSELRMTEIDSTDRRATFEYVQTGTLAEDLLDPGDGFGPRSPFAVRTTMSVRFDGDGRISALQTVHN